MNAIVLLSSHRQPPKLLDDRVPAFPTDLDDDEVAEVGTIRGREASLAIRFVGINTMEQQRAIASFPGGRRCVLLEA